MHFQFRLEDDTSDLAPPVPNDPPRPEQFENNHEDDDTSENQRTGPIPSTDKFCLPRKGYKSVGEEGQFSNDEDFFPDNRQQKQREIIVEQQGQEGSLENLPDAPISLHEVSAAAETDPSNHITAHEDSEDDMSQKEELNASSNDEGSPVSNKKVPIEQLEQQIMELEMVLKQSWKTSSSRHRQALNRNPPDQQPQASHEPPRQEGTRTSHDNTKNHMETPLVGTPAPEQSHLTFSSTGMFDLTGLGGRVGGKGSDGVTGTNRYAPTNTEASQEQQQQQTYTTDAARVANLHNLERYAHYQRLFAQLQMRETKPSAPVTAPQQQYQVRPRPLNNTCHPGSVQQQDQPRMQQQQQQGQPQMQQQQLQQQQQGQLLMQPSPLPHPGPLPHPSALPYQNPNNHFPQHGHRQNCPQQPRGQHNQYQFHQNPAYQNWQGNQHPMATMYGFHGQIPPNMPPVVRQAGPMGNQERTVQGGSFGMGAVHGTAPEHQTVPTPTMAAAAAKVSPNHPSRVTQPQPTTTERRSDVGDRNDTERPSTKCTIPRHKRSPTQCSECIRLENEKDKVLNEELRKGGVRTTSPILSGKVRWWPLRPCSCNLVFRTERVELPKNFRPFMHSVILSLSASARSSSGNAYMMKACRELLPLYIKKAKNHASRTTFFASVMKEIYRVCPIGAFVDNRKGMYYEVDDATAMKRIEREFVHLSKVTKKSTTTAQGKANPRGPKPHHRQCTPDWKQELLLRQSKNIVAKEPNQESTSKISAAEEHQPKKIDNEEVKVLGVRQGKEDLPRKSQHDDQPSSNDSDDEIEIIEVVPNPVQEQPQQQQQQPQPEELHSRDVCSGCLEQAELLNELNEMYPNANVDGIEYIQSLRPCHCNFHMKNETQLLPATFNPGPYSVVIGCGPTSSKDNKYFLQLCRQMVPYYFFMSQTKEDKYAAVTTILKEMYRKCPVGAFVKKAGTDYYDVEDELARSCVVSKLFDLRSARKKKQQQQQQQQVVIVGKDEKKRDGVINNKIPCEASSSSGEIKDDVNAVTTTTSTTTTTPATTSTETTAVIPAEKKRVLDEDDQDLPGTSKRQKVIVEEEDVGRSNDVVA